MSSQPCELAELIQLTCGYLDNLGETATSAYTNDSAESLTKLCDYRVKSTCRV